MSCCSPQDYMHFYIFSNGITAPLLLSTVTADSDRDRLRITRVMQWIREHYQKNLTLDTAASLLAVSREYFCRLFLKNTLVRPSWNILNDVRTIHLAKDLSACDDTITSLMEKHGLTNYKVFLRTFRKLYGTSPQKFRKGKS